MSAWHLAQINVGRLLAPIDAPETAEFVANLDRVNAIARTPRRASSGVSSARAATPPTSTPSTIR
jgi:hypothetical protein